jgi:hypothetical protein
MTTTARIRETEAALPAYITEHQSKTLLQVSRATFRRMRLSGIITTYTIFGTCMRRYRRSEIEALIRRDTTDTTPSQPLVVVR